jgi:hypothetical protein
MVIDSRLKGQTAVYCHLQLVTTKRKAKYKKQQTRTYGVKLISDWVRLRTTIRKRAHVHIINRLFSFTIVLLLS